MVQKIDNERVMDKQAISGAKKEEENIFFSKLPARPPVPGLSSVLIKASLPGRRPSTSNDLQ